MAIPNTFTSGTKAKASEVNANFTYVLDTIEDYSDVNNTYTTLERGCTVTPTGTPDLNTTVAAGVVRINGELYTVAGGTATFTNADATNRRWDIISINTSGAIVVTEGTAHASTPAIPTIPSNTCPIAAVYRPANDNTIATGDIYMWYEPTNKKGWHTLLEREYAGFYSEDSVNKIRIPLPTNGTYKAVKILYSGTGGGDGSHSGGLLLYINDITGNNNLYDYCYVNFVGDNYSTNVSGDDYFQLISSDDVTLYLTGDVTISTYGDSSYIAMSNSIKGYTNQYWQAGGAIRSTQSSITSFILQSASSVATASGKITVQVLI